MSFVGSLRLGAAISVLLMVAACGSAGGAGPSRTPSAPGLSGAVSPPPGGIADYQLGAAYVPDAEVGILARDSTEAPVAGLYNICYLTVFQTQPAESAAWFAEHPDLTLVRDGRPLMDPGWPDEALLDTSTVAKRARIAELIVPWIDRCAAKGYDAVEFDNLDSFTRSGGRLEAEDNFALAQVLAQSAHWTGLAVAQKNTVEYSARLRSEVGFDFAVVEECHAFSECAEATAVYGSGVIDIEYTDTLRGSFTSACADSDRPASMILRDRDLVDRGDSGYVYRHCGPR